MESIHPLPPMAGQRLARGVCRALRQFDFVTIEELVPTPGLRVDVMALGPKGEVWIIEQGYLEWCDRFFWAVDGDFPADLLPEGSGLIIADAYDAAILRMGQNTPLPAARRKVMVQKFARHAALRLQAYRDPGVSAFSSV